MDYAGPNSADMIHELLVKNGLDTIEGSKDDIPIVIQSFELEALIYFQTLADLPNTFVMGVDRSSMWQKVYYFIEECIRIQPGHPPTIPDWDELSKLVSGISPFHHMLTKPNAPLDPMSDPWDYTTVKDEYTDFAKLMHKLDIAVHPWPLQDDRLKYRETAYAETKMFVAHGVDGFFVEFPADSYRWFTDLGLHSALNFDHPQHKLEAKDVNLEITKTCIADR